MADEILDADRRKESELSFLATTKGRKAPGRKLSN